MQRGIAAGRKVHLLTREENHMAEENVKDPQVVALAEWGTLASFLAERQREVGLDTPADRALSVALVASALLVLGDPKVDAAEILGRAYGLVTVPSLAAKTAAVGIDVPRLTLSETP
jgi:hypothetical protein